MDVRTIDFNIGDKKTEIVLCLGFFDCLHLGHAKLLQRAREIAKTAGAKAAMFTFDRQPAAENKEIFTLEERLYRMDELGVHIAVVAHVDPDFLSIGHSLFMNMLFERFNIVGIVCGSDFTYGKDAEGNVHELKKECVKRDIKLDVIELEKDASGRKIASRRIKEFIKNGDMRSANSFLPLPYIMMGTVVHGREAGRAMGFPTANMNIPEEKCAPAAGVYYTRVYVDGADRTCITNIGTHPTFGDYSFNAETHILDFDKDLYGKKLVVRFMDKIRDIVKFDSKEEIAAQLKADSLVALSKAKND